jgi:hypothetical protein
VRKAPMHIAPTDFGLDDCGAIKPAALQDFLKIEVSRKATVPDECLSDAKLTIRSPGGRLRWKPDRVERSGARQCLPANSL